METISGADRCRKSSISSISHIGLVRKCRIRSGIHLDVKREAGENPARSRHCIGGAYITSEKKEVLASYGLQSLTDMLGRPMLCEDP